MFEVIQHQKQISICICLFTDKHLFALLALENAEWLQQVQVMALQKLNPAFLETICHEKYI